MKKLIILVTAAAIFVACHKKALPVVSARTEFPPAPKADQPVVAANTPGYIAAGKSLYESKCNRCHFLKSPGDYTTEKWIPILNSMTPRAKLSSVQVSRMTAYVMANAKK